VTQTPVGFAVQPTKWTRRLASSTKKSTYNRCNETVTPAGVDPARKFSAQRGSMKSRAVFLGD
jgi:hypothetical protein